MSQSNLRIPVGVIVLAGIYVTAAVGCAGQGTRPPVAEAVAGETTDETTDERALRNMESYLAHVREDAGPGRLGEATAGETPAASEADAGEAALAAAPQPPDPAAQPAASRPAPEPPQTAVLRFGFDSSEISEADREVLLRHAAYLMENPRTSLVVTGHADNRGPADYNRRLSEQRAERVAQILVEAGVPESRIEARGRGAEAPASDAADWPANRRVELEYRDSLVVTGP